jgi:hypothetical protein
MPVLVNVRKVADVAALQAARPDLKVATPSIAAGHPNEAPMAAQLTLAQSALTSAMQSEAISQGNFLGGVKGWRP